MVHWFEGFLGIDIKFQYNFLKIRLLVRNQAKVVLLLHLYDSTFKIFDNFIYDFLEDLFKDYITSFI